MGLAISNAEGAERAEGLSDSGSRIVRERIIYIKERIGKRAEPSVPCTDKKERKNFLTYKEM